MKLHPITQLMLFAALLWLAGDAILLASGIHASFGEENLQWARASDWQGPLNFGLRNFAQNFADIAMALALVGVAIWLEVLSRIANELQARRLTQNSSENTA